MLTIFQKDEDSISNIEPQPDFGYCGCYMAWVVGEITIKFISILIIFTTISGDYRQELEKRKFEDKDETDYYDSLEFCAALVWNGEFILGIIRIFSLALFLSSGLPFPRVPGEAAGRPRHCHSLSPP